MLITVSEYMSLDFPHDRGRVVRTVFQNFERRGKFAIFCGIFRVDTDITLESSNVHPCEKVIGIFFRHNFFTIYFLLYVLVFIHYICEVININSADFRWISITGYTSVTLKKGYWVKTRCRISLIYAVGKDGNRNMGKVRKTGIGA